MAQIMQNLYTIICKQSNISDQSLQINTIHGKMHVNKKQPKSTRAREREGERQRRTYGDRDRQTHTLSTHHVQLVRQHNIPCAGVNGSLQSGRLVVNTIRWGQKPTQSNKDGEVTTHMITALFLLPGSCYWEQTPCFCLPFYLCQLFLFFLKNLSLFKNLFFSLIALICDGCLCVCMCKSLCVRVCVHSCMH